jgi:DNA polymerase IV
MNSKSENLFLHADGDSFFVACEVAMHPELRGKPVIVGGDRGIAVAMSVEAKKLGVTRGMPTFRIKKLLPQVIILPHHFDLYREIATEMYNILLSYANIVEEYSIDECFALVTPWEIKYFGNEKKFLSELKKEIETKLGVTYSLGLGRTKALSKLASKLEKPGGLVTLLSKEEEVRALKATSIEDIWGIGRKTIPRLRQLGLETAYDFIKYPLPRIEKYFSRPIALLHRELSGDSVLEVHNDADPRDQKSLQSTATFHPASTDPKVIWRELAENAEHACENVRALRLLSNSVSFFVKTSGFQYRFDEAKLPMYTSDPGIILNAIESKFPKLVTRRERIRSTGVILHNLVREENVPLDLFGKQSKILKRVVVEEAADKIREKYGPGAIQHAVTLQKKG